MKKKNWIDKVFQNTSSPKGFWGRMILRGMNCFHTSLSTWGLSYIDWQPAWNVLDIGCGGGANVSRLLNLCPKGKIYGIDVSVESVAYARKKNRRLLGSRCFIELGDAVDLPYGDGTFDAITAFETIYFWKDLQTAFSKVARALRKGGFFLICCESSNPNNTMWSSRIEGMTIYAAETLVALLMQSGFENITVHRQGEENICVIARKKE